jgi:hypothetical protein
MNPRTRTAALYAIGAIAILASLNALAHSYAGLYDWASTHRLNAWQSLSWPAEIDVFLVVGELALYLAYLDGWSGRHKVWPWVTTITGLVVSVVGNVGHIQSLPGQPVTFADRLTAATSPLAAFAGLTIGLLVLKMTHPQPIHRAATAIPSGRLILAPRPLSSNPLSCAPSPEPTVSTLHVAGFRRQDSHLLKAANEIFQDACVRGDKMSQRDLAAQLRNRGHRFSNANLRSIATAIGLVPEHRTA